MSGPFVSARSLSKQFGDHRAVDNVTLEVSKGEVILYHRAIGCGKIEFDSLSQSP